MFNDLFFDSLAGGEFGFWQGSVDKLMDDFRDFKPNTIIMVPRLLNKLYDTVMSEARRKGLSAINNLKSAIQSKLAEVRQGNFSQDTTWDSQIFHQIRLIFGNKVKRVISSSAPLSAEVADFCRAMFSCMFIEGYGQTECVAGCWQAMNDTQSGETGIPTPVNHIKLVDIPEKAYFARDGVGEICIRSKAVFSGYLKDEAKTRETIDEEGWLHTGDIGRWTENNTMRIIDRKKNIYKLSQGEYIAPEKIEGIYARSQFISQVFVYGDSFQNFPVAIVVLDDGFVKKWAAENSIDATLLATPEINDRLRQAVLKDMIENGEKRDLMSFEQVKGIELITEPFTIENGLMTPTFKARRYAVEKQYKPIFDKLYKTMNA
ncbi:unnamed protein product [Rotaria sordida]|uniref:long-chain-fatty-acid--CoA ligase n=1 Tax=Rotaria sordida TaxID=392033 RepID=A0A819C739_9BILA|nr:unnamed protein product [Rotaria sordida]